MILSLGLLKPRRGSLNTEHDWRLTTRDLQELLHNSGKVVHSSGFVDSLIHVNLVVKKRVNCLVLVNNSLMKVRKGAGGGG